jgi:hypothetical protein
MNVTATGLTRASAAAAAAAGAIFIAVQIGHPGFDQYTTETTQWVARCSAKSVMAALALAGITGIYLRQYRKAGLLGLLGYLGFVAGYLLMLSSEVIAVFVLPQLVHTQPGFVNDAIVASGGGHPIGDIGSLQTLFNLAGAGYMIGGLIFGIALFRTGVLARWAAALLAISTVGTATLAVLPSGFDRPMAVPEGVALIALGVSLWRNPRDAHHAAAATSPEQPAATFSGTAQAISPVEQSALR